MNSSRMWGVSQSGLLLPLSGVAFYPLFCWVVPAGCPLFLEVWVSLPSLSLSAYPEPEKNIDDPTPTQAGRSTRSQEKEKQPKTKKDAENQGTPQDQEGRPNPTPRSKGNPQDQEGRVTPTSEPQPLFSQERFPSRVVLLSSSPFWVTLPFPFSFSFPLMVGSGKEGQRGAPEGKANSRPQRREGKGRKTNEKRRLITKGIRRMLNKLFFHRKKRNSTFFKMTA